MTMQHTVEERTRVPVGYDPRAQLLADLPVSERRLRLAGISTAVLKGGKGSSIKRYATQGATSAGSC